jgi:hypothetical protein
MSPRRCLQCQAPVTEPPCCSNGHAQDEGQAETIAGLLAAQLDDRLVDHERLAEELAERL